MRAVGIRKPVSSGRLRRSSFRISHIRPSMTPKASAASKLTRLHTITMNAGPFFSAGRQLGMQRVTETLHATEATQRSEGRSQGE
jgi:hypothetical protein